MSLRNFAAILGVVCLTVAAQAYIANSEPDTSLIDSINKLLDLVQKRYDATHLYRDLLEGLDNLRVQTVKDFFSECTSSAKSTAREIKSVANEAKSLGYNITMCQIDRTLQMLEQSPSVYLNAVRRCTDMVYKHALNINQKSKDEFSSVKAKLEILLNEAKQCQSKDMVCWTKMSTKVKEAEHKVPIEIEESVNETVKRLFKINKSVLSCKGTYLEELEGTFRKAFDDVVACSNIKYIPASEER